MMVAAKEMVRNDRSDGVDQMALYDLHQAGSALAAICRKFEF